MTHGLGLIVFALACGPAAKSEGDFERGVAPIFVKHCLECHSETEAAGKLVLSRHDRVQAGGDNGPVISPKQPESSYLWERVSKGEMPPEKQGHSQKLSDAELATIKAWIASGATWPKGRVLDLYESTSDVRGGRDWWSLQPIRRPAPPNSKDNPIDGFVGHEHAKQRLTPAPQAERPALLRRLFVDLIGLPPTAEEVEAFINDSSQNAYEKRVDQLLASPHFGERWGRHWLDLVRYADTCGYERDQEKPFAWKYRDWVIQSINADKPFDRFIIEQLAGDELPDRNEGTLIGTGFLRLGTWNDEPNDPDEYKYERLEDMVHATGTAFLGLSIKCARCHDHKFDPIPQADYYRVANAFWTGPIEPRARELLGGPTKQELGADVLGWTDIRKTPPPLFMMKKGDPHRPIKAIEPGHLTLVSSMVRSMEPAPKSSATTNRRLELARWIVDSKNPLTARVQVNRIWQHHFGQGLVRSPNNFGFKGDRPTHPELLDWLATEFIAGGWRAKPMHKLMVMSATYRQASTHPNQMTNEQVDSANRWIWRAERRRLDAESIRDAMLLASGRLHRRLGGPSFKPEISSEALEGLSRKSGAWQASPPAEQNRRSIYLFSQRSLLPPLMTAFDFCDTVEPCGQRDVSIVAPQALALLNNRFVHQQSQALAERVIRAAGSDTTSQIRAAWRFALGRDPSAHESTLAIDHLAAQQRKFAKLVHRDKTNNGIQLALTSLCHVLLNTSEFMYTD